MLEKIKKFFQKKEIQEVPKQSTIKKVKDENSTITFEIDEDLKVIVHTRINPKIALTLIDREYLTPKDADDQGAVQLAFVLIANEVTEQIIENTTINED
jgi:hypothetical protein